MGLMDCVLILHFLSLPGRVLKLHTTIPNPPLGEYLWDGYIIILW